MMRYLILIIAFSLIQNASGQQAVHSPSGGEWTPVTVNGAVLVNFPGQPDAVREGAHVTYLYDETAAYFVGFAEGAAIDPAACKPLIEDLEGVEVLYSKVPKGGEMLDIGLKVAEEQMYGYLKVFSHDGNLYAVCLFTPAKEKFSRKTFRKNRYLASVAVNQIGSNQVAGKTEEARKFLATMITGW